MKFAISVKTVLLIILLVFFGGGFYFADTIKGYIASFFKPALFNLQIESVFSPELRESINFFVQSKLGGDRWYSRRRVAVELSQFFDFVKEVTWNAVNPQQEIFVIRGINPKFLVNNQFVIGEDLKVRDLSFCPELEKENFINICISSPIKEGEVFPCYIYKFFKVVEALSLADEFKVFYRNKDDINLLSLKNPKFCLKINEELVTDKKKFWEKYKIVCRDYYPKYRGKNVIFDMRFEGKVYVKFVKNVMHYKK